MLKQHSSQNLNRVVRLDGARNGGADRVVSDDRGISRADLAPTASPDLPAMHSRPEVMPIVTEADRLSALWWSVFTFFMEGCAAYGAYLYPTAASVESTLTAAKAPQQRPATRGLTASEHEHRTNPLTDSSNVVELGRVPALEAGRSSRWNWLTSLCQPVGTLWTYWRREQQIRNAVGELAELDDRTLRDIGIPHRSQIDQAVRYCRDC